MAGIETPSTVSVQITSSMTSFTSEKRLQRSETISTLKVLWICILLFFFCLNSLDFDCDKEYKTGILN